MIRKNLAVENCVRKKFRAVFERFGKKMNYKGYSEQTVLLVDVTDVETGKLVTDHLWLAFTKGFEAIGLCTGVSVEFEARIKPYRKGYVNRKYKINESRLDYKLSHPTKIILVR